MSPSLTALQGGMGPSSPKSEDTQPGSVKTVADILTAAADLIEPEGAWTQGSFARGENGRTLAIDDPGAVCFCAVGAIMRVTDQSVLPYVLADTLDSMARERRTVNLASWNDKIDRTQAEVVAALRSRAEKARAGA